MVSKSYNEKRSRIQVTISRKDIEAAWGPDSTLSLVKHWIELGRNRYQNQIEMEARFDVLEESIADLGAEIERLEASISKISSLLLHTSKLINTALVPAHYEMELLKIREETESLNEHDSNKRVLAKIKDENFESYVTQNFGDQDSSQFVATSVLTQEF